MKKKLLLLAVVLLAVLFAGYRYLYRPHRDIASEDATFTLSPAQLLSEFSKNDSLANQKYADKTISIAGKITAADDVSVTVDGKLSATFLDTTAAKKLSVGQPIRLKGRFVGYDDLLEELKMDQCTKTN